MKKLSLLTCLLLCVVVQYCAPTLNTKEVTISESVSGLADVDQILDSIQQGEGTDSVTLLSRQAALMRWYRLLWRQGIDLDRFDSLASLLTTSILQNNPDLVLVDSSYLKLAEIAATAEKIEEIKSTVPVGDSTQQTNWPYFYGTEASRTGYSPDAGPMTGEIAWKYPKGYFWNAAPVVENGKIYTSTPAIDVVGFCFDESTGAIDWRGKQDGLHFYSEPISRWSPVVTDSYVTVRGGYDSSEIRIFDKQSGTRLASATGVQAIMPYYRKGKTLVASDARTGRDNWVFESDQYFAGDPVQKDGKLYAVTRQGIVYAFDQASNTPTWMLDLGQPAGGSISVGEQGLYVGTRTGHFYKLDLATGKQLWEFTTSNLEKKAAQLFSDAIETSGYTVVGGANKLAYVLDRNTGALVDSIALDDWVRGKPFAIDQALFFATLRGTLYRLDVRNGKLSIAWQKSLTKHGIMADLAGSETSVVTIGKDLMMYVVDPETGDVNWSHGIVDGAWIDGAYFFADWNGGLLGTPTIVDGIVYIGGPDGFVNAVDAGTGQEIWRFETKSTTTIAPTVVNDKVYFGYLGATTEHYGFDNPGEYFAVDSKTGEPIWQTEKYGKIWVGAAYAQGTLCIGNTDGYVFGVDPETGNELWSYYTAKDTPKEFVPKNTPFKHGWPPGVYSVPTFDDKNFYIGSWSGYYFAFDQKTGKLVWRCATKANDYGGLPDSAAPTLYGNYLYVQGKGGLMMAIDKRTGEIAWKWFGGRGYLYNSTAAAHDDIVYGSIVRAAVLLPYDTKMVAFTTVEKGHKKIWEQGGMGGLTAPALTDNILVSGSTTEMFITGVDPKTGRVMWRTFTGGEMLENVTSIYGNKSFSLCKNGYLFAIQ